MAHLTSLEATLSGLFPVLVGTLNVSLETASLHCIRPFGGVEARFQVGLLNLCMKEGGFVIPRLRV